jgi:ribonuclease BN (tRNA processing enzyme)
MTRLTVLGGSAAGVGTGQGCSGYLVQTEKTSLVLDLGSNTLLELRKHTDFRTLDGIVISHLHMDHVLDLFPLRFALAYNPTRPPKPVPLYLPPGGLEFMQKAVDLFLTEDKDQDTYFSAVYDMREYDPEESLTIGDFTVTFAPSRHIIPCWSIRVRSSDDSGDLFYTADTGVDGDLSEISAGATVVVAESAGPPDADLAIYAGMHLLPQQAAELASAAGATHLVLTHIWEEHGPDRMLEAARAGFNGRLTLATPGVSLSW